MERMNVKISECSSCSLGILLHTGVGTFEFLYLKYVYSMRSAANELTIFRICSTYMY